MSRAFIFVMDSFGIGAAPDAGQFGDQGSDTLGHIAAHCAAGEGDRAGLRSGPLRLPNLAAMGLGLAAEAHTGRYPPNLDRPSVTTAQWGYAIEQSKGKDTPSGHWEIAGVPVMFDWGYFPQTVPTFPEDLTDAMIERCALSGVLGNEHASGTEIIERLGEEHVATGKPIVYTSADSVIQIAAHEESFGLDRLYELCIVARELADPLNIGRVIARPFVGTDSESFVRTANRRDYSVPPHEETLFDRLTSEQREIISVGKIGDIFAHRGTGEIVKAAGNDALFDATLDVIGRLGDGGFSMTNFVDFDTLYGHRRDVPGYAAALEHFDARVPELSARLKFGDLVIITADHGCDPTWQGTDHTRECVPVLAFGPNIEPGTIGCRDSFADIGQTVAEHLAVEPLSHGHSWLS